MISAIASRQRLFSLLTMISSWLLVAFSQLDWCKTTCILTSMFGYALFWKSLSHKSLKWRFLIACMWMLTIQLIGYNWILFYPISIGTKLAGWLAHSLGYGVVFGILTLCIPRKLTWRTILFLCGLWILLYRYTPYLIMGQAYEWNPLGLTLTATRPGLQNAAFVGITGMSFYVLLTNLTFLKSWKWGVIFSIIPYLIGLGYLYFDSSDQTCETRQILLVQTNNSQFDYKIKNTKQHFKRYCEALKICDETKYDLVVFPETAVPINAEMPYLKPSSLKQLIHDILGKDTYIIQEKERYSALDTLHELSHALQTPILIGLERYHNYQKLNSACLFQPTDSSPTYYDKYFLSPWVEYLPYYCKPFRSLLKSKIYLSKNRQSKNLLDWVMPISCAICYEEFLGNIHRQARLAGSKLLVGLTNDSYHPLSRLPIIHYNHARVRSVELGTPMIRACSTGLTCAFDRHGDLLHSLPCKDSADNTPTILSVALPMQSITTPYLRIGDFPLLLLCYILVGTQGLRLLRQRQPQSPFMLKSFQRS